MRSRFARGGGFTLVELMVVVALIGVLAGLSLTSYRGYIEKARVARAIAEIKGIATVLEALAADENASLPMTLAEVNIETQDDPWGTPYQYLRIEGMGYTAAPGAPPAVAASPPSPPPPPPPPSAPPPPPPPGVPEHPRQDQFLRPVNSDFDLYSMGPDRKTQFVLSSEMGRDDIVRALDGSFIGVAGLFEAK